MNSYIKQIFSVYIFSVFLSSPYFLQSQIKEDEIISNKLIKQDFISFDDLVYDDCIMTTNNGKAFSGTAYIYEYINNYIFLSNSQMAKRLPDSLLKIVKFEKGKKNGRSIIIDPTNGMIINEKVFEKKNVTTKINKYIFKFKEINIEYGDLRDYVYFTGAKIYKLDTIKNQYQIIKRSYSSENSRIIDSLFGSHNLTIFADNWHFYRDTSVNSWAGKYLEMIVSDGYGPIFEPYGHIYSDYESYTKLYEPKYCGETKTIKYITMLDEFPYGKNISDFPHNTIERYNEYERRGWKHDNTSELK